MEIKLKLRQQNLQTHEASTHLACVGPEEVSSNTPNQPSPPKTEHGESSSSSSNASSLPEKLEIITRLKELCDDPAWQPNGTDPCRMFKIVIVDRIAAKGIAVLNYPVEKAVQFFKLPDVIERINRDVVDYQFLREEASSPTKIIYMEVKTIWPVSNRDFVMLTTKHQEGDVYYMAYESCDYKQGEVAGKIRGHLYPGGFILERLDEATSQVTYISDTDPQGSIPKFIKNSLSGTLGEIAAKVGPAMKEAGF